MKIIENIIFSRGLLFDCIQKIFVFCKINGVISCCERFTCAEDEFVSMPAENSISELIEPDVA